MLVNTCSLHFRVEAAMFSCFRRLPCALYRQFLACAIYIVLLPLGIPNVLGLISKICVCIGLAWVGGTCEVAGSSPLANSISEDHFSAGMAVTAAHELGHK